MLGGSHTCFLQKEQNVKTRAEQAANTLTLFFKSFYPAVEKKKVVCMCLLSGNHRHWQTFSEVGCGWSPVLQSLAREQECRLMSGSTAWGTRGSMPWLRLEMDPAKPAGIHTTMQAHMFIRLPLYIMIIILPKNFLKLQYSVR